MALSGAQRCESMTIRLFMTAAFSRIRFRRQHTRPPIFPLTRVQQPCPFVVFPARGYDGTLHTYNVASKTRHFRVYERTA